MNKRNNKNNEKKTQHNNNNIDEATKPNQIKVNPKRCQSTGTQLNETNKKA